MHFAWVSWTPPNLDSESELQFARAISSFGKAPLIKQFCGLQSPELPRSKNSFFETHAAGIFYLVLSLIGLFLIDWSQTSKIQNSDYRTYRAQPAQAEKYTASPLEIVVVCGWIGGGIFYGSMVIAALRYSMWLSTIERKYQIPRRRRILPRSQSAENCHLYEIVAEEIEQGLLEKVAWTRAIAESTGDEKLAKSLYIRFRVQTLEENESQKARAARSAREQQDREQERQVAAHEPPPSSRLPIYGGILLFLSVMQLIRTSNDSDTESRRVASLLERGRAYASLSIPVQTAPTVESLQSLTAWYARLAIERASLDRSDPSAMERFNIEAAKYKQAVEDERRHHEEGLMSHPPK